MTTGQPQDSGQQPPGWYPDPYAPQMMLRFWNGQEWTDQSTPRPRPPDDTALQVIGWMAALVFPIVGIVIGVIVSTKGNTLAGLAMCGLSCVSAFIYYDFFFSPASVFG